MEVILFLIAAFFSLTSVYYIFEIINKNKSSRENEVSKEELHDIRILFSCIAVVVLLIILGPPILYKSLLVFITVSVVFIGIMSRLSWRRLDYKKNLNVLDLSDYRTCIIALTSKIMKADGAIKDCELDKVKTTIRRYYKTDDEFQAAQKKFQEILDNDLILLNQICDNINNNLNYVAKSELIMELLAIAYADYKFIDNERLMIETIANRLKISSQEYKSIYAIFIMKYKQGYYNGGCPTVYSEQGLNTSDKNYNDNDNHNENEKRDKQGSYRQYNGISEEDAYIILGIEKSDSDTEIKKAYRALAVKCHPDNASSLGDEAIRQATETMKQINMAWDVVKMARGIK